MKPRWHEMKIESYKITARCPQTWAAALAEYQRTMKR